MSWVTEVKLARLAAGQWGMFTSAQAAASGVARSTLTRREQTGVLSRVRPGVYRHSSVPIGRLDDVRAAWLATAPGTPAWDRLAEPGVVVGGAAAAWVYDIGDSYPSPYLLYSAARRQTKHDDIRYSTRGLREGEAVVVDGLPVTTRERTIADLLEAPGVDVSIVARALRDVVGAGIDVDTPMLIGYLARAALRLGYASGAALHEHLLELSEPRMCVSFK